jgi:accessory gene regulator protein AgrB
MVTMVLVSSFLIINVPAIRIVILLSGLVGAIVVWFFVPEGRDYTEEEG